MAEYFSNIGENPVSVNIQKSISGKVYGYPIGYISTRSDGTKWRKISANEWEQVLTEKEKAAIAKKEENTFTQGDLVHFKDVYGNMAIGRVKAPHGNKQVFVWNDKNRFQANIANDKVTKITDPVLIEKYKDRFPVITESEKKEMARNKELDEIIAKLTPVQIHLLFQVEGPKGKGGEPIEYGSPNSYTLQHSSLKSGLSQDTMIKLGHNLKLIEKIPLHYQAYENEKYDISALGKEVLQRLRGSRAIGFQDSVETIKHQLQAWKDWKATQSPMEEKPVEERGFLKSLRHEKIEKFSLKKDDQTTSTIPAFVKQFDGKQLDVFILKDGTVVTAPMDSQVVYHGEYGTARQLDMSDVDAIYLAGKKESSYITPDNYIKLLNAIHYGTNFNHDKLTFKDYDSFIANQKYGLTESDLRTSEGVRNPDISFNPLDIGTAEYDKTIQEKLDKYNEKKDSTQQLIFPSYEAAHLWLDEFTGQISDGKYENTKMAYQNGYLLFHSTIKVDKTLKEGKTEGTRWYSWKPNFNDLIWLFSKERAYGGRDDVRSVFSRVSNKKIKEYIDQIYPIFISKQ